MYKLGQRREERNYKQRRGEKGWKERRRKEKDKKWV